jgi:hypothetical protein
VHSYHIAGEQTSFILSFGFLVYKKLKLKTECLTKRNHQLEAKSDWRRTFWKLVENANDWNLSVQDSGNSIANLENRRQTRRNLIGSVEELYNEIENRCRFPKEILSKVLKLEIWHELRFS